MPWEITIINGTTDNRRPLGSREHVVAAIMFQYFLLLAAMLILLVFIGIMLSAMEIDLPVP